MDTTHLGGTETLGCQTMKSLLGKEGLVKVAFEPYCWNENYWFNHRDFCV